MISYGAKTLCNLWRIGYTLSMNIPIPHAAAVIAMTDALCALKTVVHDYTARLIKLAELLLILLNCAVCNE